MGSTKEVARAVAETLRENGLSVEVQQASAVCSLNEYGAVVLAAALYMGRLHKDARQFLAAHRSALMNLPVALFILGPVSSAEKDWTGAQEQVKKELAKLPWFTPVDQQIVGGKFDPAKLGFPFNLIPALMKMPVSDVRDWTAIRNHAKDIAGRFQPALQR
jgi:menaquinone-dependent protoporphyrinogen oxidase